MNSGTEIRLHTRQGDIAGLAWGPEDGTPVLALHGWLDNADSFQPLAAHLPGMRIVALDFPGHGHSDWRPGTLWYHYIDYVWDVICAAGQLGWTSYHLLGHSLGAAVASAVAATCPDQILSLNLVEAIGPLADDESATAQRLAKACEDLQKHGNRSPPVYDDVEKLVRARAIKGGIDIDSSRLLVNRNLLKVGDQWEWHSDPRLMLASPVRMTEKQVLDLLRAVQAPTIIIEAVPSIGVFDEATLAVRIKAIRPRKHIKMDGHHHLHMSSPGPVATAIMENINGG